MRRRPTARSLRVAIARGLVGGFGVWGILAAWMVYTG